jgi:hypothetical protein
VSRKLLGGLAWVAVGLTLAVAVAGRRGAPDPGGVLGRIDWGDLEDHFRVHGARIEERTDRAIGGRTPFRVVAFEVEAVDQHMEAVYMAKAFDRDGVQLPVSLWPGPVLLKPDFGLEPPFGWAPGDRSHGWFLLPAAAEDAGRVARIVVCYHRG